LEKDDHPAISSSGLLDTSRRPETGRGIEEKNIRVRNET